MLSLNPKPTFKASVGIPIPGEEKPVNVKFEFNGLSRTELQQWFTDSKDKTDEERLPLIIVNWFGIDEPYTVENLARLLDRYPGSAHAIVRKFTDEVTGQKLGN